MPSVASLFLQTGQAIEKGDHVAALNQIDACEMEFSEDQMASLDWYLVQYLKGEIYQDISQIVTNPQAQEYWAYLAMEAYMYAHDLANQHSLYVADMPVRILNILKQIQADDLMEIFKGKKV